MHPSLPESWRRGPLTFTHKTRIWISSAPDRDNPMVFLKRHGMEPNTPLPDPRLGLHPARGRRTPPRPQVGKRIRRTLAPQRPCGVGLLVPWYRRWRPDRPLESSPGLRPSGRCPGFAPEHPPGLKGRQRSGDGRNGGRIRGCAASSGDPSGRGFDGTWGDPGQWASRTRRAGLGWVRAARWAAWPPRNKSVVRPCCRRNCFSWGAFPGKQLP